jgi:probable rRNA maturation factor
MTRRARAVAVTVQRATTGAGVPTPAEVRKWARAALTANVRGELTVRIVSERESAELNGRYRGKAGPTNVLSFRAESPAVEAQDELLPFGDVVICAEVVAREAREQGKALAAHWAHMVVHGALHLQGYDHENRHDAGIMEARERAVLNEMGFPDPYSVK